MINGADTEYPLVAEPAVGLFAELIRQLCNSLLHKFLEY